MTTDSLLSFFYIDPLAKTLMMLVIAVGIVVARFAKEYMRGERQYARFFCRLSGLVVSLLLMVASDHIALFLLMWGISNVLLIQLMTHHRQWRAANNAGYYAARTMGVGFICLATAMGALYWQTQDTSIHHMVHRLDPQSVLSAAALLLVLVAAMSQSAIWPFHRWLISSLNSPTPVSAMMHAGLVNGGGFLLARFAPLYLSQPHMLNLIFVLGLATALIGTVWKLLQSDVKRMLACSTMGQMGYMVAQCGLGLFPAAIAHLCWHGLFKANLFLSSSGAAFEKRLLPDRSPSLLAFLMALVCGVVGSYLFTRIRQQAWLSHDTTVFLTAISFIFSVQSALVFLNRRPFKQLPVAIIVTVFLSSLYGFSVRLVETMLAPMQMMQPQALNAFYIMGILLLVVTWLANLFKGKWLNPEKIPRPLLMLYVKALNGSQPYPSTITAHRNHYRYE